LLDAVLEASDDAVLLVEGAGAVARCSRSAPRILGHSALDLAGRASASLFAEHLRTDVAAILDAVRAGDTVYHYETEIEYRDGQLIPVSLSAAPVAGGAMVLVIRDVTERQINQATLSELEKRVRDSEALAHVGGWLWDVTSGAVQWTEELHHIHGVDPLDFDGTIDAHLLLIHEDDRARVSGAMHASIATGAVLKQEYRVVRPDGAVRAIRTRATPTADSAGAIVGLRGTARDVTPE
jgi:PAS domain S-box-containing protein